MPDPTRYDFSEATILGNVANPIEETDAVNLSSARQLLSSGGATATPDTLQSVANRGATTTVKLDLDAGAVLSVANLTLTGANQARQVLASVDNAGAVSFQSLVATDSLLGMVKPDNSTIMVNANGVLSAVAPTLPTASTTTLGVVKVDGVTTVMDATGTLTAVTTPTAVATSSTHGVVRPDNSTITINGGVISASVMQADGKTIQANNGLLSATAVEIRAPKAFRARHIRAELYPGARVAFHRWNPADTVNFVMDSNNLDSIQWQNENNAFRNLLSRPLKLNVEFRIMLWGCPANVGELDAWWTMSADLNDMATNLSKFRYGFTATVNTGSRNAVTTSRTTLIVPANGFFSPRFYSDQSGYYSGNANETGAYGVDKQWATTVQIVEEGV